MINEITVVVEPQVKEITVVVEPQIKEITVELSQVGIRGAQGLPGEQGIDGAPGDQGPIGEQGPPGNPTLYVQEENPTGVSANSSEKWEWWVTNPDGTLNTLWVNVP